MKQSVTYRMIDEQSQIQRLSAELNGILNKLQIQTITPADRTKLEGEMRTLKAKIDRKVKKNNTARQDLIKKIEKITKRPLITFFSELSLLNEDATMMEDILRSIDCSKGFDLLINSPGGSPDAAEKLIHVCRHFAGCAEGRDWNVIVVNYAKSAATIVGLGASHILMTPTAELGPIDPQIRIFLANGSPVFVSAHQIYYGFQRFLEESNKSKVPLEQQVYAQLALKYSPEIIEQAYGAIQLTDKIAKKLQASLKDDLKLFKEHKRTFSHGRPILLNDLMSGSLYKQGFLQNVSEYYKSTKIEALLWELCIRSEAVTSNQGFAQLPNGQLIKERQKIFESSKGVLVRKHREG